MIKIFDALICQKSNWLNKLVCSLFHQISIDFDADAAAHYVWNSLQTDVISVFVCVFFKIKAVYNFFCSIYCLFFIFFILFCCLQYLDNNDTRYSHVFIIIFFNPPCRKKDLLILFLFLFLFFQYFKFWILQFMIVVFVVAKELTIIKQWRRNIKKNKTEINSTVLTLLIP